MTQQAQNSIRLYKGNSPDKIGQLLKIQNSNVVNELMAHYNANSINELAVKLSFQK